MKVRKVGIFMASVIVDLRKCFALSPIFFSERTIDVSASDNVYAPF